MMDADRLASFYRPAEIQALRTDPVTAQHQDQLKMLNPASVGGYPSQPVSVYRNIQTYVQQQPQPTHTVPQTTSQPQARPVHSQPKSMAPMNTVTAVNPQPLGRDRSRPRGRMTPYAYFVQDRREYYRRHGIPVEFTAFSKECAALWKELTDEEKGRYQKLSVEDKERFQRETASYNAELGHGIARDGSRRGRKRKEPGQPKRNMCAFLHFCAEKRPKLRAESPTASIGALAKQLSLAWKVMTPEQKRPYEDMAMRDKLRYEQQKQAYEAGYSAAVQLGTNSSGGSNSTMGMGGVLPRSPYDSVKPIHHSRRKRKDPDMPKRNMSAFMFYSKEKRPHLRGQNPTLRVGQLAQILAAQWKIMTPTEKAPFDLMAHKDKERYEVQLKAYRKGEYIPPGPNTDQHDIDQLCQLYS